MEILEYFNMNENPKKTETVTKHWCKTILELLLNHALNEFLYIEIDLVIDLVPSEKEEHYRESVIVGETPISIFQNDFKSGFFYCIFWSII